MRFFFFLLLHLVSKDYGRDVWWNYLKLPKPRFKLLILLTEAQVLYVQEDICAPWLHLFSPPQKKEWDIFKQKPITEARL